MLSFLTLSAFGVVSSSVSFSMLLTSSGVRLSIIASNSSYVSSFSTLSAFGVVSSSVSFSMLLTSSGVRLSIIASNSSYVSSFSTLSVFGKTFSSGVKLSFVSYISL